MTRERAPFEVIAGLPPGPPPPLPPGLEAELGALTVVFLRRPLRQLGTLGHVADALHLGLIHGGVVIASALLASALLAAALVPRAIDLR